MLLAAATLAIALPGIAAAHGVAGQRFFPTTFAVDDPFTSDELSVLGHTAEAGGGAAGPRLRTTSLGLGIAKRILPNLGIELDDDCRWLAPAGGGAASGPGNLAVSLKWQALESDTHEGLLSFAVSDELGGTGARAVGADPFSTVSAALLFGKGLGDLPDAAAFLRPLAVTGAVGPSFPVGAPAGSAATLGWGFTVQYSLMYLQSAVRDVGLPPPLDRMVAIVEVPAETCLGGACAGRTTATVNPGLAWIGRFMELGAAAEIPTGARALSDVGVFLLVHLFVDDLFPRSVGRPLFP